MKAVKGTVRKYYKYVAWTQPVLTGNTTSVTEGDITVSASTNNTGYSNIYGAMDGVSSGTNQANIWMTNNSSTGWWQVVFPYKIRITGLTHYNSYGRNSGDRWITGQYFTSSDKTTPIGDSFTTDDVNWQATTIENIPSTGITTDTIYFNKTNGGVWSGIGELQITAQVPVESTSSDYDYYEDVEVHKLPKENKRIYYKYQYDTFTQPTLTENGSMSGDAMAVSISYGGSIQYTLGQPYTAFSPNTGETGFKTPEVKSWARLYVYLPLPTKLTNISFKTSSNDSASGGAYNTVLYGGDYNGATTETIKNIGNVGQGGTYDSALSTDNYYQYFTLYFENGGWSDEDRVGLNTIVLQGQTRETIESTESDYDYYKDVDVWYGVKF